MAVLERRADGTPNRAIVAAPHGGAVQQLDLGVSHRGDAIFAFLQGNGANAQIAAVVVRAPPGEFVIDAPDGWVKAARIPLQWEAPLAGAGKITYSILVDDREVVENITGDEYLLNRDRSPTACTRSRSRRPTRWARWWTRCPGTIKVDRTPPRVHRSLHHKPWVSDRQETNLFGLEPNFVTAKSITRTGRSLPQEFLCFFFW